MRRASMLTEPSALLIVSNSGRAMAESAARGGYVVTVLDAFCDADTRSVARCVPVPMGDRGLDAQRVRGEAGRLAAIDGSLGFVYGAGLEHAPSTLSWMAERFRLLGNAPEVLELLRDPRRFFALLDELEILYPQTIFEPPSPAAGAHWLVKEAGTSGGMGVRRWRDGDARPAAEHCFQRFLEGPVMSVLFIADGADCSIIGVNRLRTATMGGASSFHYGGALNRVTLSTPQRAQLGHHCAALVKALRLRGINNLDFVLDAGRVRLLELNPRPSATLGLYDEGCPGGWIRRHVRACLGDLPGEAPPEAGVTVSGHRIIYAPHALGIPPGIRWPHWCHDRPAEGTRVAPGAPLCTVSASGRTAAQTERRLLDRERGVLDLMDQALPDGAQVALA